MERLTFPSTAVAAELIPNFVEARLHTDDPALDFRHLQETLAESIANPIYVLVDPETGERLARGSYMSAGDFRDFLVAGRERAKS